MNTPAVCIEHARVLVSGRELLCVPHLRIEHGERVAVVGPNGAGKSTLLKLLGAMLPPQQGRVEVLGSPVPSAGAASAARHRSLRCEVGLLMQGLHLVPRLTARENVLVGALARLHGADAWRSLLRWYPPALVTEADAALAALGIAHCAAARTDRLSGGERQKVGLARLQLQRARLVLADEPTSALDPAATAVVCAALRAAVAAPGHTLVAVVHDLELLPLLATRVIAMADGQLAWDWPIEAVTPAMLQALYRPPPVRPLKTVSVAGSMDGTVASSATLQTRKALS